MDIGRIARRAAVGGVAVAGGVALQQAVAGAEDGTSTVTDTVTKTVRKAPAAVKQAVSADTATNTATNVIKRTVPKAKAAVGTASISTTAANPVKTVSNTLVKTTNQLASAAIAPAPQLFIQITSPLPGTIVDADDPLLVTGTVGAINPTTNIFYVLDASDSTEFPAEPCGFGDFPACPGGGDPGEESLSSCGEDGTIFECEVEGIVAINRALSSLPYNATLITFWGSDMNDSEDADDPDVQLRDLNPGGSEDFQVPVSLDTDDNGTTNLEEVVLGEVVNEDDENDEDDGFEQVLQLLDDLINPPVVFAGGDPFVQAERNIVFFFSDGVHLDFEPEEGETNVEFVDLGPDGIAALDSLAAKGVTIFSYSVGQAFDDLQPQVASSGCGFGTVLQGLADATGGTCTNLIDPADAPVVISQIPFTEIGFVGLNVNGTVFEITDIDEFGNWSFVIPGGVLIDEGNNVIQAFVVDETGTQFREAFTNVITVDDDLVAIQDFDDECEDDDDCDDDVDGDLPKTGADNTGHLAATGLGTLLAGGLLVSGGRHRRRRRAH